MGHLHRIGRAILLLWFVALISCAHRPPKTVPGIHLTLHLTSESEAVHRSVEEAYKLFEDVGCPLVIDDVVVGRIPIEVFTETAANREALTDQTYNPETLAVVYVQTILPSPPVPEIETYRGLAWTSRSRETLAISELDLTAGTLAHEIGHALGLQHVDDPANVMCTLPCQRGEAPKFNPSQVFQMRAAQRSWKTGR